MTRTEYMTELLYPDGKLTSDPMRLEEYRRLKREWAKELADRGQDAMPQQKSAH